MGDILSKRKIVSHIKLFDKYWYTLYSINFVISIHWWDQYTIVGYKNQLIYVHKLLKGSIFISDSGNFKVPKHKYFNKRHKNSY